LEHGRNPVRGALIAPVLAPRGASAAWYVPKMTHRTARVAVIMRTLLPSLCSGASALACYERHLFRGRGWVQDDTAHKRLGYYPNTFFAHAPCKNGVFRWNGVTEDVETRKGVHSRNLLQVVPLPLQGSTPL
jgi:hypothetical protein